MTAYNQEKLDAYQLKDTAQNWHKMGMLSDAEWEKAKALNPVDLYMPNWFVRIGLGIFTLILLQSALGLIWLVFDPGEDESIAVFLLFYGIMSFIALETLIVRRMRHFGSGVDDMTLYFALGLVLAGIFIQMPHSTDTVAYLGIAFPLLLFCTVRYLDRLLAAATFGVALLIILMLEQKSPALAPLLMPVSGILFSLAAYFFARMLQKQERARHWHNVLVVIELLATITFYISGNYWVIQQAGTELFQMESVPMAWFFWIFTFAVPPLYIWQGLRNKDRLLLDIGLACAAAAIFTFRYYFHVLPLDWAAVVGGALLFGLAYFSIRYLRSQTGAYTYEPELKTFWLQELEEQLIEQTIANQPTAKPDNSGSFGGGQMGGGGASGEF